VEYQSIRTLIYADQNTLEGLLADSEESLVVNNSPNNSPKVIVLKRYMRLRYRLRDDCEYVASHSIDFSSLIESVSRMLSVEKQKKRKRKRNQSIRSYTIELR
jgi:hypothetical protein